MTITDGNDGAAPAVSVVVPTYERRDLVVRAVRSVLAQTHRDFELIVVDDGSTDGTEGALRGLDPRLRYLWQENRGVAAARNAGLELARGEIVAFLDSDDRWLPHHLATVTEMLARHPQAVLATTSPRFRVAGREDPSRTRLIDPLPLALGENFVGYPSGVAVRRDAVLAAGGFDERLRVCEGFDLALRMAVQGSFALLRRRTIVHQHTRGSLMGRASDRGEYLPAAALAAENAVALMSDVAGDRPDLVARARGRVHYVAALEALTREDADAVRAQLALALRLLPELNGDPAMVAKRLSLLGRDGPERLRYLVEAASLWPEQGSDVALFLRTKAAAATLRARRLRPAARLLSGWPIRRLPGFVVRTLPFWAGEARDAVQKRVHRGRESAAVALREDARPKELGARPA